MADVFWPVGSGSSVALTADGEQAITINDQFTYIDGVTVSGTGNRTLNLTIDSDVKLGAEVLVAAKTDGTETTIFGTGIDSATITGGAGKTKVQGFKYNGTVFLPVGTAQQID